MNKYALMVLLIWVISLACNVGAKEVQLSSGETYSKGGLTVTCGQSSTQTPLALNDCQYWDDFNNKCLFEKTTYIHENLECIEECQHWDKFKSTCYYQSKCTFYPSAQAFVRTACEKFDDFNNTCLKTKEKRVGQ
jgi:hypothetical protein